MTALLHATDTGPNLEQQTDRLPAGPLIEGLVVRYGSLLAVQRALGPAERRKVQRYAHSGLSAAQADRAAVKMLGLHPASVWGNDWWAMDDPLTSAPTQRMISP